VEVEPAQVKAGTRDALDRLPPVRRSVRVGVNLDLADAYAMPDRRDAEHHRPVPRILPDRGIAIVHELIAVVLELLAEVVQHRPRLVAGRAAQAVLAGESRQGVRGRAAGEHNGCENQSDSRKGSRKLKDVAKMKTTRNAHGRTPRQDQIKIWFVEN